MKSWRKDGTHSYFELSVSAQRAEFVDAFDPGKDANRIRVTLDEFLAGALASEVRAHIGSGALDEALAYARSLTR